MFSTTVHLHTIPVVTILRNMYEQLSDYLDLRPCYGGIGLQTLNNITDEEMLGSFVGISTSFFAFGHKT